MRPIQPILAVWPSGKERAYASVTEASQALGFNVSLVMGKLEDSEIPSWRRHVHRKTGISFRRMDPEEWEYVKSTQRDVSSTQEEKV